MSKPRQRRGDGRRKRGRHSRPQRIHHFRFHAFAQQPKKEKKKIRQEKTLKKEYSATTNTHRKYKRHQND